MFMTDTTEPVPEIPVDPRNGADEDEDIDDEHDAAVADTQGSEITSFLFTFEPWRLMSR